MARRCISLGLMAMLCIWPTVSWADLTGTPVPLGIVDTMLVDPVHGQVFVSGPTRDGATSLVVLNADGSFRSSVPDEAGALGMAMDGDTLYVARCNPTETSPPPATGQIDVIDTATLTRIDSFSFPVEVNDPLQAQKCSLALAGGRLWIASGDQPTGVTSIDIAPPHAGTTYHYGGTNADSVWAPPGDPDSLVALQTGNPSEVALIDAHDLIPSAFSFYIDEAQQAMINNDASVLFGQSFDGIHAYSGADATQLGLYPRSDQVNAMAVNGDGSLVAEAGFAAVQLFHGGTYDTPFATIDVVGGITGLAFTADEQGLYVAAASDSGPSVYTVSLTQIATPDLTISAAKTDVPYHGRVQLTAQLGGYHAGETLSVYAVPDGGAPSLVGSGTLDGNGILELLSPPLTRNTSFYAHYDGDQGTTAGDSDSIGVTVHVIADLKLPGGYRTNAAGYRLFHFRRSCASSRVDCPALVGSVSPNRAGHQLTFRVQRHTASGWHAVSATSRKIAADGRAHSILAYPSRAIGSLWRVRVLFPADAAHGGGQSAWRYLQITR
jgi:hypothetical protein